MSDYYWPRTPITKIHKQYITQIRYSIHLSDGIGTIKSMNLLDKHPSPEDHANVPSFYVSHIKRFLWRHYLVITLYEHYEGKKPSKKIQSILPYLLKVIVHMDNVIESIIRPCQSIPDSELEEYRSKSFEDYLIAEYIVGRHDPDAMDEYRDIAMFNIEQGHLPHDSVWENEYARRLPPLLSGSKYDYDISKVPKKDYTQLSQSVVDWYTRGIDMEWLRSIGTLGDEGEGNDENGHEEGNGGGEGEGEGMTGIEPDGAATPPPNQLALAVDHPEGKKRSLEGNDQSDRPQKTPRVTPVPEVLGFDEDYRAGPSRIV